MTTHVLLVFTDDARPAEKPANLPLYVEGDRMAFYYYAGLRSWPTPIAAWPVHDDDGGGIFAARGRHIYLGSCYSESAPTNAKFTGFEFSTVARGPENLAELKFILRRSQGELSQHLLEDAEYHQRFRTGGVVCAGGAAPVSGPRLDRSFSRLRANDFAPKLLDARRPC